MKIINPFAPQDPDRAKIWKILVEDDIDAFIQKDWKKWSKHFDSLSFHGTDAGFSPNPDSWRLAFPTLSQFAQVWKNQANEFKSEDIEGDPHHAFHRLTTLRDIEIHGARAIARKKFDGIIHLKNGKKIQLCWQSHYGLHKQKSRWKITELLGYLPNPMGGRSISDSTPKEGKALPAQARNHKMAGPYSPVLEIAGSKMIVISGQAAIDPQGQVVGTTMEEQAHFTLENCRKQLADADCTLADVFKVNAYVTDLKLWPRFNAVYQEIMPQPFPVRTTVETGLLPELLVEIEMWAIKK